MGSKQRGGTTLVEVLVAIFIMAIGLMTLLTLFPLGALSMAQALQDSRAGQAAANAAALAEAKQLRHDDKVVYDKDPNASGGQRDVFVDPLPRGNKGTPNKKLPPIPIDSGNLDPSFPSYPVFVDPFGFILTAHPDRNGVTIGDPIGSSELGNNAGIPRRTTRYVYGSEAMPNSQPTQLRWAYRFHSLLDDLQFDKDTMAGIPVGAPTTVERENRYSWAYLLRRPRAADPSVVDLSVILYNSRPVQTPLPEHVFTGVTFNVGSTQLDVVYSPGAKPDIKKGSWVMDATLINGNNVEPHGFFYRVVGVTDNGGSLTLELQEPIKPFVKNTQSTEMRFTGTLIFMEYVVEVFEKGSGWKP